MLIRVTVRNNAHKIQSIRLLRFVTSMGLKEAKDFVEGHMANVGDTFLVRVDDPAKAFNGLTSFDDWAAAWHTLWSDLIALKVETETPVKLTI